MGKEAVWWGVLIVGMAGFGAAEDPKSEEPTLLPDQAVIGHLERLDDPPASEAYVLKTLAASLPTIIERNGFVSVQVNVGERGVNIQGDAANEPSIAVDPTAPFRLAVGWRQFDSISSNFREAGWSHSVDGGRSWAPMGTLDDGIFRSDPVLGADREGRFYYYSLISTPEIFCSMFISEDGGASWFGPIEAFGGDKAWFTVDTTAGVGDENIYVGWAQASNEYGLRTFIRSFDGGMSYTEPLWTHPTPTWGTVTVDFEGVLYMAGNADYDRDRFVVHRSFDVSDPAAEPPGFDVIDVDLGGAQRIGGEFSNSPNPAGLLGQLWIDSDHSEGPNRGNLYIVSSVDPDGSDPMDVHFVRSTDGGETWSEAVRIHSDNRDAWQWFGTMSVAPNGRIDVVWVESVDYLNANMGELYYAASSDGGYGWTAPVAITPVFDSWIGWPQQDKIGDYFHMVSDAVGADLIYAATFNGEEDVFYLRIGDTDCNSNLVGDSSDLRAGLADCNQNALLDSCEIDSGSAVDDDEDGVIDECRAAPRRPGDRVVP